MIVAERDFWCFTFTTHREEKTKEHPHAHTPSHTHHIYLCFLFSYDTRTPSHFCFCFCCVVCFQRSCVFSGLSKGFCLYYLSLFCTSACKEVSLGGTSYLFLQWLLFALGNSTWHVPGLWPRTGWTSLANYYFHNQQATTHMSINIITSYS